MHLIIPADLDASYQSMMKAVASGEIPQQQLDAAVLKILKAKASLGLHKARLTDLNALPSDVGKPDNIAEGQQIADSAITLVRDNGKVIPLKHSGTVAAGLPYTRVEEVHNHLVVVVLAEDVRTDSGSTLERQIKSRVPDAHVFYVDSRIAAAMSNDVLNAIDQAESVVAAVYVVPTAGRVVQTNGGLQNSVALTDANGALLQKILERAAPKTMMLAMGNPYLAMDFPQAENYMCAFSNTSISESSVVKALFGEIEIHGHVPVTIPNIAARGSGIDRQPAQGGKNVSSINMPK